MLLIPRGEKKKRGKASLFYLQIKGGEGGEEGVRGLLL